MAISLLDTDDEIIVGDYCFYNTDLSKTRRLGTLMDLHLLKQATEQKIPFVSFGALNDKSHKLKHKGNYAGTHIFKDGKWIPYNKPTPAP